MILYFRYEKLGRSSRGVNLTGRRLKPLNPEGFLRDAETV